MYTVATQCYFPVAVGARREERNHTPGMHCANVGIGVLGGVGFCEEKYTPNIGNKGYNKSHKITLNRQHDCLKHWLLKDFKEFFIRTLIESYNHSTVWPI